MAMPKFPTAPIVSNGTSKITLTEEQEKWFRAVFPEYENSRIMKASGLKFATMHRMARELGLKKSKKGLHAILKRQAVRANRIKEKNGYYDRLRERGITPECREGYQRYLHSDRYRHPMTIMKERNPRRYKMAVKKRKETRIAILENEKRRISLGLPRRTNLCIPEVIYTKHQIHKRYSAKRRGYSLGYPYGDERMMLFYDDDTIRSVQFENNCKDAGFVILPDGDGVRAEHDYYITGKND